jgi:enoyl-CoA hydratase/carnithine racemase
MSEAPSAAPVLLTEIEDKIVQITLNRPHKRNALDADARAALADALESCRRGPSVVILTGAGATFCAGMDLTQLSDGDPDEEDQLNQTWRDVQDQIRRHPAVFIAAVDGYALGGGTTLINVCDLAVVTDRAQIGIPELGFGFYPGVAGPAAQLRLTQKRAAWMILTAQRIDGQTAVDWGLANLVVAPDDLAAETLALARRVAQFDPVAVEWSKKALWQIPMQISEWRAALEFGAYVNAEIHARSQSHRQALQGFIEGRPNPGQGAQP